MKSNVLFVSMITVLVVLTGGMVLSGCGNPTGGGGGGGGSSPAIKYYIWVSTTGSDDSGTGTNEANAYKTIGKALSVARSKTLIRVVDGLYTEHLSWPTFEAVYISGESRDGTIISGDASGACITIPSTAETNQTIIIQSLTLADGHSTGNGGGIYIDRAGITLHLKNVVMMNNIAGASSYGGAIYGNDTDDNVIAENCTFEGNTAGLGGAVFLLSSSGGNLSANNCSFSDNVASKEGGAIYVPYITLEACSLSGNQATSASYADGGAVYLAYGGTMTNCLFFNNQVNAGAFVGLGGAIRKENPSALNIVNCTFASNEANYSGGSRGGAIDGNDSQTILTNCILYGNRADVESQLNTTSVVSYSDIQDGYTGTGNVSDDPAFAGISIPYGSPSDLALTASSSTFETRGGTFSGAPTKDYAGMTRSGHMSMGAYQY
jgi:predicted outer membrane repeat protein